MVYDYKKGLIKGAKSAVLVLIAGLTAVYSDNMYVLAIIPMLEVLSNYLKNK